MTRRFLRMAIVLGLITAVGPFAVDMYLPALPSMGKSLEATPGAVQMSLMAFIIVIGICQLFYGPLSDIVGRKLPIWKEHHALLEQQTGPIVPLHSGLAMLARIAS